VRSPLAKSQNAFCWICIGNDRSRSVGLTHALSGRAAYIHVGAIFGTIMTLNVWMRFFPRSAR